MTSDQNEKFESTVQFFRTFALHDELLDDGQRAGRDSLISSYPDEWREAQRRGPLSEEEEFETHDLTPEGHTVH